jgi:nitrous oxidase accessory protein NosD
VGFGSSDVLVEGNHVAHAHGGIVVEAGPATIRNNRLVDNLLGIALPYFEGVEVTGNVIEWQGGIPDGWYYQGTRIYDHDMPPSGIIGAFPPGYPLIHDNVGP